MRFKVLIMAVLASCLSFNAKAEIADGFGGIEAYINAWDNKADQESGAIDPVASFPYAVEDLIAVTSDNITFQLLPNTALYSNAVASVTNATDIAFWTDSVDGGLTPGNNGNKYLDALNYRTKIGVLSGSTNIVFNYTVDADSLDTNYIGAAFIKVLDPNSGWATLADTQEVVSGTGSFTIEKELNPGDEAYAFQVGFRLLGMNANFTNDSPTYASHGSVTMTIDDIIIEDDDFITPDPDPMSFAIAPAPYSAIAIEMTATTAYDTNDLKGDFVDHGVEYQIENTTLGYQSEWQDSPYFIDEGIIIPAVTNPTELIINTDFDPVDDQWEAYDSVDTAIAPSNFVTVAGGVATVTPSAYSSNEVNYFTTHFGLEGDCTFSLDAANITADGGPTVFVKEFTSGWGWIGGQFPGLVAGANTVNFTATAGNIYQVGVLANGSTSGSFDISNPSLIAPVVTPPDVISLEPETEYCYRVRARDKSSQKNTTGWSSPDECATTFAGETNAPTPNPMTFADAGDPSPVSILLTASTATDGETAVQYLFSNTVSGATSGWQSSTVYLQGGLAPQTTNSYTVKARDLNGNETDPSAVLDVVTLPEPSSGALDESLTDLSGDTSDPFVVHGLAKAGLETGSINPAANIVFTTNGAVFSSGVGFEGRDILRTVAAAYEDVSFTAYATISNASEGDMAAFIGIGQGIITGESGSNWGVPELQLEGVNGVVCEFKDGTAGSGLPSRLLKIINGAEIDTPGGPTISANEQFRAELVYNADSNTVRGACDRNYIIGDPYVEEDVVGEVTTVQNPGATNEYFMFRDGREVRVYFGGGEGTVVRDIEIIPDTLAPLVPVAGLVISSTGQIQWDTVVGQIYDVEYKNALTDPTWTVDPANNDIPGTGSPVSTIPVIPGTEVFYQISTDYE